MNINKILIEKTEENFKTCLVCNRKFTTRMGCTRHVFESHNIKHKEYYDQYYKTDKEGICTICGKETTFLYGKYLNFCSYTCSNNDINNNKQRGDAIKVAWEHVDRKVRYNKTKQTLITRYGADNIFDIPEIRNKVENTNLERYGNISAFKNKEVQQKQKDTLIKRYGVSHISKIESTKNKIKLLSNIKTFNNFQRFSHITLPQFDVTTYLGNSSNVKYVWKCVKCNNIFNDIYDNGMIPKCNICFPVVKSSIENTIENLLIQNNINYRKNDRSIIQPQEIDFYLPDRAIGIEVDGIYWHSEENGCLKNYHNDKTKKCEDKNIKLIHIFEDELKLKSKIVINRVKNILGLIKYKIYARKCEIKEIDGKLKNKFLNKYHLQGEDKSCTNLGLFYKTRLVSVMTFSKLRKALGQKNTKNHYELSRFCSINNFSIIGGASKLLNYFEKIYLPKFIITYADRRWSMGNLYYKLGFNLDHISPPNYWYLINYFTKRVHRFNYRKNILKDKLKIFNPNLSEWENMKTNGYDRIWDCGNLVFKKEYIYEN